MDAQSAKTGRRGLFTPSTWCRRGWTWPQLLIAVGLMAAGVYVTLPAWRDLVDVAISDEEQSHALLVPVVAAWLLWVRRERLRRYVPRATWVGPAVVAAGWLLHRVGDARNVYSFW